MYNCKMEVTGETLTITVNLSEKHGASGSGKSEMIASTGAVKVPGREDIRVGLIIYRKSRP